jgi:outer membrane lipoprotein SlyB
VKRTNGLRLYPAISLAALALAACGPRYSPDTYDAAAVQQANKVERGIVVGFREVAVSADGTVGAVAGGAAGGIAASQSPVGPVTRAFTALGGTLVGGLIGTATEHAVADTKAWEYIVKEPNGDLVSVTQTDKTPLPIGQSVLVITGKQARIVPDYTAKFPEPQKPQPAEPEPVKAVLLPMPAPPPAPGPSVPPNGAAPAAPATPPVSTPPVVPPTMPPSPGGPPNPG